jgi:hypothetical protein
LKAILGNSLTITGVADPSATVAAVKSCPAHTIIAVVGHSDTVGPIINGLGGGDIDSIGLNEFDKLFVLFKTSSNPTTTLKLRYGAAT